jgi:hypothetical protein
MSMWRKANACGSLSPRSAVVRSNTSKMEVS